jgi:hypothetical protein
VTSPISLSVVNALVPLTVTVVRASDFQEGVDFNVTAPVVPDAGSFLQYLGDLPTDMIENGESSVMVDLTLMVPPPPALLGDFEFTVKASGAIHSNIVRSAPFTVHIAGVLATYAEGCTGASCVGDGGVLLTVPSTVSLLDIKAWGAGGCAGSNGGNGPAGGGGGGGFVEGMVPVTGLEQLEVHVGRSRGENFNGGCGGEGSYVARGGTWLVIAGGGGGGGASCQEIGGTGGGGGGPNGQAGGAGCGPGGGGGTQVGSGSSLGATSSGGGLGGGGLFPGGIGGDGDCTCYGNGGGGGGSGGSAALEAGVQIVANKLAAGAQTPAATTDTDWADAGGVGAAPNKVTGDGLPGHAGRIVVRVPPLP